MLVRNPGKLVSQRQLLAEVWGPQYRAPRPTTCGSMSRGCAATRARASRPRYFLTRAGHGLPVRALGGAGQAARAAAWRLGAIISPEWQDLLPGDVV